MGHGATLYLSEEEPWPCGRQRPVVELELRGEENGDEPRLHSPASPLVIATTVEAFPTDGLGKARPSPPSCLAGQGRD